MPSSRQAPAIVPRPSATQQSSSAPGADSKSLNPRILRKREADRKCQRLIRERTKSRIADLEATVKEYERKDASGLSNLMRQLAATRQEKDALANKVKTIESVLSEGRHIHIDSDITKENRSVSPTPCPSHHSAPDSLGEEDHGSRIGSFDDGTLLNAQEYTRPSVVIPAMPTFKHPSVSTTSSDNSQDAMVTFPITTTGDMMPSSLQPDRACQCSTATMVNTPVNAWRYANDVLSSRFLWTVDYNNMLVDDYIHDTPVRAVLDGWDAVERRGPMHPSWQIMKQIDQFLFWKCEPRERLALLFIMHMLFRSHSNCSVSELPVFFRKGPSNSDPNSYAINYFTWPGVRKMFFENQHRYCTNDFGSIFTRNLRILWPFEMRDCYNRNTETGLYSISPLFRDRVKDLNAWSMGSEMFQKWPELRSHMPATNSIPASVSNEPFARTSLCSSADRALSPRSTRQSALVRFTTQDQDQDHRRDRQTQPDAGMQQIPPVVYDQMIWAPMVSSQYGAYSYAASASTSTATDLA